MRPIGMYAHHQGAGHLQRCRTIASRIDGPVTIFTSSEAASSDDVLLPLDVAEQNPGADADGMLHWAPLGVDGLRERMAIMAYWIRRNNPRAFYVDVSVEVTLFVRLMGVPVVTLAMPGERADLPHQAGYRAASAILAAWPALLDPPTHLGIFEPKLHAVGGISRFESKNSAGRDPASVVVMFGHGGTDVPEHYWDDVAGACPDYDFTVLSGTNRVDDPFPLLSRAGVVVSAAGQNSVADIAAARAPALFVAQDRAFDEQHATVASLEGLGIARGLSDLPDPSEWQSLLDQTARTQPNWGKWQVDGAARRAAAVIEEAAV